MKSRNALALIGIIFFQVGINSLIYADDFKIIYIIHGDGNYLFHDKEGNALDAAERILKQSKFVAENVRRGEVFIFYQKQVENFLLFFPKDDGEFYHYKNGVKLSEETYSRKEAEDFEIEAGLIKKYSESTNKETKNILLYYGHEIPQQNNHNYHSSYPGKEFGINVFAKGVERLINSFSAAENKFDLIVLSTCRNGNQFTINAISPFTEYLIASPADIHLSHLNSESLINLNNEEALETYTLAKKFTQFAYEALIHETSTEIFIAVYDIKRISEPDDNSGIKEFYRRSEFGKWK